MSQNNNTRNTIPTNHKVKSSFSNPTSVSSSFGGTKDWDRILMNLESYFILHQKRVFQIGGIILGLIILTIAYFYLYLGPRQSAAKNQIFMAQQYLAQDSLNQALKGDGNNPGFETIASDYPGTESANLAEYYLGTIYLKKGMYQKAIDALNSYKAKDELTGSLAVGMVGDAYSELNQLDKAIDYYQKAEKINSNNFTTPMFLLKEGLVLESQNQNEKAKEVYEKIKKEYSESTQAHDIDKYIARVDQKIKP